MARPRPILNECAVAPADGARKSSVWWDRPRDNFVPGGFVVNLSPAGSRDTLAVAAIFLDTVIDHLFHDLDQLLALG